jgi:hypothetical protein
MGMFYDHLCSINNVGINYMSWPLRWGVKQKTGGYWMNFTKAVAAMNKKFLPLVF